MSLTHKVRSIFVNKISIFEIAMWVFDQVHINLNLRRVKTLKTISISRNIHIGVLAKNRPDYLEKCLTSLLKSLTVNPAGIHVSIYVFDDNSSDSKTLNVIEEFRRNSLDIEVKTYSRNFSGNSWASCHNWAIAEMLKNANQGDFLGTCDSDIVFSPNWLGDFYTWATSLRTSGLSRSVYFSAFNSSDQIFHRVVSTKHILSYGYVEKIRMGGCHLFAFYEDLKILGTFPDSTWKSGKVVKGLDDESKKTRQMCRNGFLNACLSISLVEHIGSSSILNENRDTEVSSPVFGLNQEDISWVESIGLRREDSLGFIQAAPRNIPIDLGRKVNVLIPLGPKDLNVVSHAVQGAQHQLGNHINEIFVVTPSSCLVAARNSLGSQVTLIDEQEIISKSANNSWVNQQFLKWKALILLERDALILDADTVLLRPYLIPNESTNSLLVNEDVVPSYRRLISNILDLDEFFPFSFVTHHQLVSFSLLSELIFAMEDTHSQSWEDIVLGLIEKDPSLNFSEYETYGQFISNKVDNPLEINYAFNRSMGRAHLKPYSELVSNLGEQVNSASFHWYIPNGYNLNPGWSNFTDGEN
jgi:glycosyltransferase involved in cell wall biosynthesis